ncbi:MAG: IS200/IS605 family transposase [Bacteroidales bacterium]|nr:IS200/IS605 family transposase [Bacteroidales bacterium]
MSHTYHKLWYHFIFSTKDKSNLIKEGFEKKVYDFIKNSIKEYGGFTAIINGTPNHIHILFYVNPNKSISDIVKTIKGSTSHWINQQNFLNEKFAWQVGYSIFTVIESQVNKVFNYIKTQKEHHKKLTFQQELEIFFKLHKINFENKNL